MRGLLAVLRILIGLLLVSASIRKWTNPAYFHLQGFASILAQKGAPFPFYKVLLDNFIFPHATTFSTLAAVVESVVGVSFLVGAFTTPASIAGMLLMLNYSFATDYGNPANVVGHLFLIALMGVVGFYLAGMTWGADAHLARSISPRLVFFPFERTRNAPAKKAASA